MNYISVDANICHGRACIKGTRIMVSTILDNLAAGLGVDEIRNQYPSLSADAVNAAIDYAAEFSHERVLAISA